MFPIPLVPVLTRGMFNFKQLVEEAQGNTLLADTHIREGIVIRPMEQELNWGYRRMIFKMLSSEYLTRKGGTELH